jgi:hypothetical protein
LSPTAVKAPVDADGHQSYFSNKNREGADGGESHDGMQMGRFVVKSGLRMGADEIVRCTQLQQNLIVLIVRHATTLQNRNAQFQQDGRTRGGRNPRGAREDGPPSGGKEKTSSELAGGWRRGAGLNAGSIPDRPDREKRWNNATSIQDRVRGGNGSEKVPEWMMDEPADQPKSLEGLGSTVEVERQPAKKGGLAALQPGGLDEIAAYRMQMKEKEKRAKGISGSREGERRSWLQSGSPHLLKLVYIYS